MSGSSSVPRKRRDSSARSTPGKRASSSGLPSKSLQRLAAAHEACKALLVGAATPAMLQALATALRQILEAEVVVLRAGDRPPIEVVSPRGADGQAWNDLIDAPASGPAAPPSTLVHELGADRAGVDNVQRIVVLPLDPAQVRGVVWLGYAKRSPFTAEELVVFDLLGDYMTHALRHATTASARAPDGPHVDDLVSQAAHDLRTPLTPISMLLQTLERKAASGNVDLDSIARARRQVQRLTDMVSDLVDLSRLHEGRLLLEPSVLDLRDALERGAKTFRDRDKRHTVELTLGDDPLWVIADADRLAHAVTSLLEHVSRLAQGDAPLRALLERRDGTAALHIASERPVSSVSLRLETGPAPAIPTHRTPSLGLGVRLADALFERLGASLKMSRARDGSTTFDGAFPLVPPPTGAERSVG